jgi:hypothetical protein
LPRYEIIIEDVKTLHGILHASQCCIIKIFISTKHIES